jgi:hypothetical protein
VDVIATEQKYDIISETANNIINITLVVTSIVIGLGGPLFMINSISKGSIFNGLYALSVTLGLSIILAICFGFFYSVLGIRMKRLIV